MKLDKAIEVGKQGRWDIAQIRSSPGNRAQWFVLLKDIEHKSFILADEQDKPIAREDMNELVEILRAIGLKSFTVYL